MTRWARGVVAGVALWTAALPAAALAADSATAAPALREALAICVERGMASLGRHDGFLGNPAVRIAIPEQFAKVESALRMAGQERHADRFAKALNRAAERATPAARPVLLAAAGELGFDDAARVLAGSDTAATDVLRRHTLGRVITVLNGSVADAMDQVDIARRYKRFIGGSPLGGLVLQPPIDLDAYVVGRIVDAIFLTVGHEERRIRQDPDARPTALLRQVFGPHR